MRLSQFGRMIDGGGALWLLEGAPARVGVVWTLTGTAGGTLTPLSDTTGPNGTALAKYAATSVTVGGTVNVSVDVYA